MFLGDRRTQTDLLHPTLLFTCMVSCRSFYGLQEALSPITQTHSTSVAVTQVGITIDANGMSQSLHGIDGRKHRCNYCRSGYCFFQTWHIVASTNRLIQACSSTSKRWMNDRRTLRAVSEQIVTVHVRISILSMQNWTDFMFLWYLSLIQFSFTVSYRVCPMSRFLCTFVYVWSRGTCLHSRQWRLYYTACNIL